MDPYEILLDGDFGFEITYASYKEALTQAAGSDLTHTINSPGGAVPEATAMRNALIVYMSKYPDARVHFNVQGWAQSAATYFMTVKGATVTVGFDSLYMYHNPQSFALGDQHVMTKQAAFLQDLADVYVKVYAERSGKSIAEVTADMDAETYFIGQEIIDAGFADAVTNGASEATALAPALVEMGRKRQQSTFGRLAAAAYGGQKPTTKQPGTEGVAPDNTKPGDIEMSDEKSPETPDVSGETKRAEAWMAAVEAEPEMKSALGKKFAAGEPTEFFKGIVAAADMRAEAKAQADAQGENPPEVVTREKTTSGTPEKNAKTAGMTGEMAMV